MTNFAKSLMVKPLLTPQPHSKAAPRCPLSYSKVWHFVSSETPYCILSRKVCHDVTISLSHMHGISRLQFVIVRWDHETIMIEHTLFAQIKECAAHKEQQRPAQTVSANRLQEVLRRHLCAKPNLNLLGYEF